MDWFMKGLKALYESYGTAHPKLSLIVVACLGAVVFAGLWSFAAKQVAKDHQALTIPGQVSGPAATSGNESPAVTGNGNTIKYGESSPPPENKQQTPK
jgi:hypothetical protein